MEHQYALTSASSVKSKGTVSPSLILCFVEKRKASQASSAAQPTLQELSRNCYCLLQIVKTHLSLSQASSSLSFVLQALALNPI
ncbi:hypothetical protein RRG08_027617 [Elysia crispata]|uniref:Uncharacterized protein n=1 Tax=Elysia crispata TaxID=231223 RepID=A0AAE1DXG6_9GAST|nr:hypothetical protein RRG08_027617 [Elysia crispata]